MEKTLQDKVKDFKNSLATNESIKENDNYNATLGITNHLELKQVRFYIEDVNDRFGGSTHLLHHLMLNFIADFEKLSKYQIMRLFKIITDSLINWCSDMVNSDEVEINNSEELSSLFDMYVDDFETMDKLYRAHSTKCVEEAYKYLINVDFVLLAHANNKSPKAYTLDEVKSENMKFEKLRY